MRAHEVELESKAEIQDSLAQSHLFRFPTTEQLEQENILLLLSSLSILLQ